MKKTKPVLTCLSIAFICLSQLFLKNKNCNLENKQNDQTIINAQILNGKKPFEPEKPHPIQPNNVITKYHEQKEFVVTYFQHLTNNKILNEHGCCGYTALGMLLTYYDTVWNDGVVKNSQEASSITKIRNLQTEFDGFYESPGVKQTSCKLPELGRVSSWRQEYSNAERWWLYYNALKEEDTLLGHLVSIAMDKGLINKGDNGLGVSYDIMLKLFNGYIETNPILKNQTTFFSEKRENNPNFRNHLIAHLKQGRPLTVGIPGHCVVAYYYDEENDQIYMNEGFTDPSTNYKVINESEIEIQDFYGFIIKDQEYKHVHKNRYFISSTGDLLCSCQLLSHEHHYDYYDLNDTKHSYRCYCEDQDHKEDHVFPSDWDYDMESHFKKCVCGHEIIESHHFTNQVVRNNITYLVCGTCGCTVKQQEETPSVICF